MWVQTDSKHSTFWRCQIREVNCVWAIGWMSLAVFEGCSIVLDVWCWAKFDCRQIFVHQSCFQWCWMMMNRHLIEVLINSVLLTVFIPSYMYSIFTNSYAFSYRSDILWSDLVFTQPFSSFPLIYSCWWFLRIIGRKLWSFCLSTLLAPFPSSLLNRDQGKQKRNKNWS